jgi:hypothetical protein
VWVEGVEEESEGVELFGVMGSDVRRVKGEDSERGRLGVGCCS